MATMFMWYADTEASAWNILTRINTREFSHVKHKVTRAYKTNKPNKYLARLFILHPLRAHDIDMFNAEFTDNTTGDHVTGSPVTQYIGYYPLVVNLLTDTKYRYVLMLLPDEREQLLKLARRCEYNPETGFTRRV